MKILIADDHTIVREGIKMILMEAYPIAEITDVPDSGAVVAKAVEQQWDLIICDISMPPGDSGLEAIKKIRELSPQIPVIILSMHEPDKYAVRAIKAGAMGYLTKDAATFELVKAVDRVMSGKKYLSPDVAYALADAVEQGDTRNAIENLSERELEVFKLLASGKSVSDIAKQLLLCNNTISTFRLRLFEKMGFHNNLELIRYAIDNNLI